MRKLIFASLFAFALAATSVAQSGTSPSDTPNMGRAPSGMNGIGRLDARVFDTDGNPVPGVYLKLESERTDGFYCEAWNTTDSHGVAVLPPIHMGRLHLVVKAKGYEDQKLDVDPATLGEPLRITLRKK
jgi:hypothetical protein